MFDADWDGKEDAALLVYSDGKTESMLRFCLYYLVADEWVFLLDEPGAGTSYLSAQVSDLTGSDACQLFLFWSRGADKMLQVFDLAGMRERAESPPTLMPIGVFSAETFALADLDGDQHRELFYVQAETTRDGNTYWGNAQKISADHKELMPWKKVALDSNVSAYTETIVEEVRKTKHPVAGQGTAARLYVNARKGTNVQVTELIVYSPSAKNLLNLTINTDTLINISTMHPANILPQDINNNGQIEVPVFSNLDDTDNPTKLNSALQELSWQRWDENGGQEVFPSVANLWIDAQWILRTDTEPFAYCTFRLDEKTGRFTAQLDGEVLCTIAPNYDGETGTLLTNGEKQATLIISEEGAANGVTEESIGQSLIWLI